MLIFKLLALLGIYFVRGNWLDAHILLAFAYLCYFLECIMQRDFTIISYERNRNDRTIFKINNLIVNGKPALSLRNRNIIDT